MWLLAASLFGCGSGTVAGVEPAVDVDVAPEPLVAPPIAETAPARVDVIEELYRDGFAPGTTVDDFVALSVPRRGPRGPVRVVKVWIDDWESDAPKVYFIDTTKHETHWWFARALMGEDWDVEGFAKRSYHRVPRPAVAVNLVLHTGLEVQSRSLGRVIRDPITVERGEEDAMPPEMAAGVVALLQSRMAWLGGDRHVLLWLPPDEASQGELAAKEDVFRASGVGFLDREELLAEVTQQVLNPGVAFGRLRSVKAKELKRTVVSRTDVLLLDHAVNELPVVAGVITEEFQTPLSHVSIASRARGTPNLALREAAQHPRIAPLIGELVRFEVTEDGFAIRAATRDEVDVHEAQGRGVGLALPAPDLSIAGLPPLSTLGFTDSTSVGAKAANVAELRRLLGDRAPDGFAVPFAHYRRFMDGHPLTSELCEQARADCLDESRIALVCDAARSRCDAAAGFSLQDYAAGLLGDPAVRSDPVLREACLDGLRFAIGHVPVDASVATELDARVAGLVGEGAVRLRSSTNAEDLPDFSGAGLYRSVSASATGDRRASARIRKVWASTWSWRAVEERSVWGIDHSQVAMGVLVHPAFPDEQANGVLVTADLHGERAGAVTMNLQKGEAAVTNPEDGATPEVVVAWLEDGALRLDRRSRSSLSEGPILTDGQLAELFALSMRVRDHFAPHYRTDPAVLALDLEVKLVGDRLVVKQARPYPLSRR